MPEKELRNKGTKRMVGVLAGGAAAMLTVFVLLALGAMLLEKGKWSREHEKLIVFVTAALSGWVGGAVTRGMTGERSLSDGILTGIAASIMKLTGTALAPEPIKTDPDLLVCLILFLGAALGSSLGARRSKQRRKR